MDLQQTGYIKQGKTIVDVYPFESGYVAIK